MAHRTIPAGAVSLRSVFPAAQFFGTEDIFVTSCCADADRCRPGDLFVAVLEADRDGHDRVWQAIERGAAAVLAERPLPVGVPLCIVDDSREAYGELCHQLAGRPGDWMTTIGVAGSCGKTSTAWLVRSILRAAGCEAGLVSSLQNCDGVLRECGRREVTPPQWADWLSRMAANGCSHAVVELDSATLATRRAAGVRLDIAVLTSLRGDQPAWHGSVVNHRRAVLRCLDLLHDEALVVLDVDDATNRQVATQLSRPLLTTGLDSDADIQARLVERHKSEQTFLLIAGTEAVPVRTATIGDAHMRNCLLAAAVGLALEIDLPVIARGLEAVCHVPGRMERIEAGQPFAVFVDAARTPSQLRDALRTLRSVTTGRLICVFGPPADGDPQQRPLWGRVVERWADEGIITAAPEQREPPLAVAHDVLDGYRRPAAARVMPNRRRAIGWAIAQARPGDTVLVAGGPAGEGPQATESDDRQVALQALRSETAADDGVRHLRLV